MTRIKRNIERCHDVLEILTNNFCLKTESIISKIRAYKVLSNTIGTFETKDPEAMKIVLQKIQNLLDCLYIETEREHETYTTICLNEKKLNSVRNPHNDGLPFEMLVLVNAVESIVRFLEYTGGSESLSYHDSVYYLKVPKKGIQMLT